MEALYAAFFADPMYYIGIIFTLWGLWGVMLFVVGFAQGARHLFTYSEADSHMKHYRERITLGLILTMVAFGSWELVRVIAGEVPLTYLWVTFVMYTPWWLLRLLELIGVKEKPKAGGH